MGLIVKKDTRDKKSVGSGLINNLIDRLKIEIPLTPNYKFCGPGTNLKEKINQKGFNKLDDFCKIHDIAYDQSKDLNHRHEADKILENNAWTRVLAKDSKLSEKIAAYLVTNIIKAKRKMGAGITRQVKRKVRKQVKKTGRGLTKHKRKIPLKKVIKAARAAMNKRENPIQTALDGARFAVKNFGGRNRISVPRILPIPKRIGGFLLPAFVIPLLSALSAAGVITSSAVSIGKSIKDIKNGNENFAEMKRHNKVMEEKKLGSGLYLKPYRKNLGIYLSKN